MNRNMERYYAERASEYDRIYDKPERQADLAELKAVLSFCFKGLDILESACGTGYWTQYIARSAKSITATDYNAEMLAMAAKRDYGNCPIAFKTADVYNLPQFNRSFNAGFAGFLWSHVPISRRTELVKSYHQHLIEGAAVVWIDGRYVEGSSTVISHRDAAGNSYQQRKLENGSRHEVIKNYPAEGELEKALKPFGTNIEITWLTHFWLLSYNVKK